MDHENGPLTPAASVKIRKSQRARVALGYLVAAACLVWVFHDIQWSELLQDIRGMNWWWAATAVACDIVSYLCQGVRWQLLLHATGQISIWRTTQAIYAGLFINEILPLRVGELVRIYLVSRWLSTGVAAVLPSILAERFFDATWLTLAVGVSAILVPLPSYLLKAENVLGALVLIAAGLFAYIVLRKHEEPAQVATHRETACGPLHRLRGLASKLSGGLRQISRSRSFYESFAVSALILIFQILAFWLVLLAYGLKVSVWVGAVALLVVHLGTAIPGAPSNVGTYQFFCVVGLTMFGVDKTAATGFSVVVFLLLTIPLWAIGSLAFSRTGLTVRRVREEIGSGSNRSA